MSIIRNYLKSKLNKEELSNLKIYRIKNYTTEKKMYFDFIFSNILLI